MPSRLETVCHGFDLGDPIGERVVARGAMGLIRRVDTVHHGRPRTVAVKEAFWGATSEAEVAVEVGFRDACAAAGIPSPAAIPTLDDTYWLPVVDPDKTVTHHRCHAWVDGTPGSAADPLPDVVLDWLATIHALDHDAAEVSVSPWYLTTLTDWDDLLVRGRRAGAFWADPLAQALPTVRELADLVAGAPIGRPVWTHRDVGAANLILADAGPVLLDWENSGPLPPDRELAAVLAEVDDDRRPALYRRYREAGGPARIHDSGAFATVAAIQLNFLGEQADSLLHAEHAEHHDFAAAVVRRSLGHPIRTVADYDRMARDLRD